MADGTDEFWMLIRSTKAVFEFQAVFLEVWGSSVVIQNQVQVSIFKTKPQKPENKQVTG